MSNSNETWRDLTVAKADELSEFYQDVLGWEKDPVDMNGYHDYIMKDATGNVMGGICHRQGANADVPGGWITYFTVSDFDEALRKAKEKGATVMGEVRQHGNAQFVYITDPSGACFALYGECS